MDPVSPLPALFITLLVLLAIGPISRFLNIQLPKGHISSIDGLRGFLALFVFLHHSCIWYFFCRTHAWLFPPSYLYNHFGPTSVALFFMITAFLFTTKLIDARSGELDWLRLYIGRITRIIPLYLFTLFLIIITVAVISDFQLREPVRSICWEILLWLACIRPDINGVSGTTIIVAGVVWSLLFEWLFYASLAIFGKFAFSVKTSLRIFLPATIVFFICTYLLYTYYPFLAWWRLSPFAGGILAALLAKNEKICRVSKSGIMSMIIVFFLVATTTFYFTAYEPAPLIMLTFCFIGIACGNDLFGLLTQRSSRLLGQISYSIYLLHGIILFTTFNFILGQKSAANLSPVQHWSIIACCSMALIPVCGLTYRFIEIPGITYAGTLTKKSRSIFKPRMNTKEPLPIHRS